MAMQIKFHDDAIEIADGDEEVLYWHKDEWREDPDIVPSIVNAVFLALTQPDALLRILRCLDPELRGE